MKKNDVVQFNENHKWCGSLGIIEEVRKDDYLVGVPIPQKGTAYIFATSEEFDYIGHAVMVLSDEE